MAVRRIGNTSINFTPTQDQTQLYNLIGRDAGQAAVNPLQQINFGNIAGNAVQGFFDNIGRRANAIGNTLGTTAAILPAAADIAAENRNIEERDRRWKENLNNIYSNAGYNSSDDFWNEKDAAEQELFKKYGYDIDDYWNQRAKLYSPTDSNSDQLAKLDASREAIKALMTDDERNRINRLDDIERQVREESRSQMNEANQAAKNWEDYRNNSWIGQKINQDQGKFAGDALTTLSTGVDLAAMGTGLPMGVIANAAQGGIEGLANELSENGFQNFDWDRARNNVITGAVSGAATAGLNKMIPTKAATKAPGFFKSVAQGAGRGALSGAVGGAVGAGVSSAMNGQDIGTGLQNALTGAVQGAASGGVSGGIMGGVNNLGTRAINAIDNKYGTNLGDISKTGQRWTESGDTFMERFRNTRDSGDSAFGNIYNNYKYAASMPDSEDGYKQGYVTAPNTSDDWKQNVPINNRHENADTAAYRKLAQDLAAQIDEEFGAGTTEDQFSGINFLTNPTAQFDTAEGVQILTQAANKLNMLGGDLGRKYANQIESVIGDKQRTFSAKGGDKYTYGTATNAPKNVKQAAVDYSYDTDGRLDPTELVNFYNETRNVPNTDIQDMAEAYEMRTNGRVNADELLDFVRAQDGATYGSTEAINYKGDGKQSVKTKKGFAMLPNTSDDWKQAKMAEEAQADGMAVLKSMSKAELQDELRGFDYTEADFRGMSKKDLIEMLTDTLPYGAESYAGGNDSTGRVDAEKYVRSLTADSLRDWMINEEGYSPERVPKTKETMINRLERDFVLDDLIDTSYKPKSKYQQDYLVEGQLEPYDTVLNRSIKQGLSGPELADVLADYSELPSKVTASQLYKMAQKDPALKAAISYTAAEVADSGEKPTYQSIAKNNWNEVRSHYVQDRRYNGPGSYYDNSEYEPYRLRKPMSTKKGFAMMPDTSADWKESQYPDDIKNMKINRNDMLDTSLDSPETALYRQLTGDTGNSGDISQNLPLPANTGDAWDNLAREFGYNTYNDAIRAFQAANPGKPVSAGAVTTWLDANEGDYNPNQVQITQNATMPTEVQEAEIVPSKTSKGSKMRYAQGKELLAQYGSVDQPMARATKAPETFQKIAEMGFTKPADVEKISNAITGSNGAVSKLTKSVIASAKPVNTFDGATDGQTLDDYINLSIEHNMLSGTNEGKAVKRGINAYMRSLPSHADGSVTFEDSAADTFKVVQNLEARAAELEGRGGSTYHRATTQDLHQAAVLKDVAGLLKDRIYSGADVKSALTPEVATELKSFDPNNKNWAKTVDDFVSSAKTAQDLRSFQAPFVRANRYIDNQYVQAATAGGRMAASAGELPAILPTTKAGVIKQVVNNVWNSNPAHRAKAAVYGKLADNAAASAPQAPTTSNPQTAVYDLLNRNNTLNVIGRNIGEEMGQAAQPVQNYIQQASAEAGYVAPLAATTSTYGTGGTNASSLEDLAGTGATTLGTTPTTVSDALTAETASTGANNGITGQFSSTGNDQVDLIGRAMELAMAADDAAAFGALYSMYASALQKADSTSDLSAAQQTQIAKFDSAEDAINELESLYNEAGGGKGPIAGNLQSVAGDWGWDSGARTYNQMAEGLVNQIAQAIGKTDSLNTEGEVKRALKLVPSLTDDAQTAQNKLRTLREMLAQTKANYYGAYGVSN